MLSTMEEYFDLGALVRDFQPCQVSGVITDAPWKLNDRLNVIVGHSGSGKTRVLSGMKRPLEFVPASVKREAPTNLSHGQKLFFALEALLQVQPAGSCLMIDDALVTLDEKHLQLLWCKLKRHHLQVVIATGIYAWPASAALVDVPVKLFRLELPPRGSRG